MKKLTMIFAALLLMGSVAFAQQSKSDENLEFRPHWTLGLQGGVSYTIGEASFGEMISPAAQLSATYKFHHAMGVRFGFSGWQGKGYLVAPSELYRFQFAQLHADYMLDLVSLIGGFKHDRIFSTYLFAGIAGAYGFNNKEAGELKAQYPNSLLGYWDNIPLFVGRAGLGVEFWVAKNLSLGLELNGNMYSDRFNSKTSVVIRDKSKKSVSPDIQLNALLGIKYRFGGNVRQASETVAAAQAAEAEAAAEAAMKKAEEEKLAAEKAAAEKAAAEKAAAEKAAAEKAAEKAAAEKAAAEKAAADRAALAKENSQDIFFNLNSIVILDSELSKLKKLAQWMQNHTDFDLMVVGYADKATGTSEYNRKISARRAEVVKNKLVELGVSPDRITSSYESDKVQPFADNNMNRVAICTLK